MKKASIIIFVMLLTSIGLKAQTEPVPRFTFGAEWGYIATFYSGYHFNFFAPEGYRADPRHQEFTYISNGEVYLHAGYNLNEKYNLSLYLGFSAIGEYHHSIPVSVRLTRYYKTNNLGDRWFGFIDLGSGVSIKKEPDMMLSGKIGAGYRLSLSRRTSLDFIAGLRTVLTHPDIYYYGTLIPQDKINRNNAYMSALSLSMSLTF